MAKVKFPDEDPRYEKLRSKISISAECKDFLLRLLDKDPDTRLGSKDGIKDIMSHPWMAGFDVDKLLKKELAAPYVPSVSKSNPLDVGQFDSEFTGEEAVLTAP